MHRFERIIVSTWHDIGHVPTAMSKYGFRFLFAVPQSMFDCWEFYCCEIDDLPGGVFPKWADLEEIGDQNERIGYGLSQEMADKCREWLAAAPEGGK